MRLFRISVLKDDKSDLLATAVSNELSVSLSTLIRIVNVSLFYPAWKKWDRHKYEAAKLAKSAWWEYFLFIPSTYNEFTVTKTVCRNLLFHCQWAFTPQWSSELSGCLCLETQWTIQVESPSAHTPGNTLHCCHCKTQVLYKPSCHGKARRENEGGWLLKERLGTRTTVSGCSERRLLTVMRKTERLGICLWETETVRRDNASTLLCPPSYI